MNLKLTFFFNPYINDKSIKQINNEIALLFDNSKIFKAYHTSKFAYFN